MDINSVMITGRGSYTSVTLLFNGYLIIGAEQALGNMTIIISFFCEPVLLGRSLLL